MIAIAQATSVDFTWLATGDPRNIHMTLEELQHAVEDRTLVNVPHHDTAVSPGPGPGAFADRAAFREHVPFNASYINRLRRDPDHLVIVEARDDSMEPTIADGDLVMIDTADTALSAGIWALVVNDAVTLKRLNPTHHGIEVTSDNPLYGRQQIGPDALRLIGRVVWIGRILSRAPA